MIDRQQIFNTAYLGLKSQGFVKSEDQETGTCLYRGPDGLKCALGWCIPDAHYRYDLETMTPDEFPISLAKAMGVSELESSDIEFLVNLQNVHDTSWTPDDMKSRLLAFADSKDLEVPADA